VYVDEAWCVWLGPGDDAAQEIRDVFVRIIAQPEPPSPRDTDAGRRAGQPVMFDIMASLTWTFLPFARPDE
jgi:hypothetical protein